MKRKLLLALAALACSPLAWGHPQLMATSPKSGLTLSGSPPEVRVKFNEPIEGAFSSLRVVDGSGKVLAADRAAIDEADPTVLVLRLDPIPAGSYTVRWAAVGRDGHRVRGEFGFAVK